MGDNSGTGRFCSLYTIALDKLNLTELKTAFENIIKLFPEYTIFKSDDKAYYDIVNFL